MRIPATPIPQRSRYYHSQIDMELLQSGKPYEKLPESYVIFITNYDPFNLGKYRYSFRQECREVPGYDLGDGSHTIILNNRGKNPGEVTPELVTFLEYTRAAPEEGETESADHYVREIQRTIQQIKASREMGGLYMTFQEMLNEEREEGRKEGQEEGQLEERQRWVKGLVEKGLLNEKEALQMAGELSRKYDKQ